MSGNAHDWKDLEAALGGAFSARAHGFLGSEFSLSDSNGEFGSLRLEGSDAAYFESGDLGAEIEHGAAGCRMLAGGEEVLTAETAGSSGAMKVKRGEETYEAETSLLRNTARASSPEGGEARVVGRLFTNKSYEVAFEEGLTPVAIFLLYYLAASRRRAFRVGATVSAASR